MNRIPVLNRASDLIPKWPTPPHIQTVVTTRWWPGQSKPPFDTFNLASHVGDDPNRVESNRQSLTALTGLASQPIWLEQVHGTDIAILDGTLFRHPPRADGAITQQPGTACAILTADCLPVLFCDSDGFQIGAAHAGWRGLHAGILEKMIQQFSQAPSKLMAWLGPAIGSEAYIVGSEVRDAFVDQDPADASAFHRDSNNQWHADLYQLARNHLRKNGIHAIFGGGYCTFNDDRFYSYRQNRQTGRMATVIWIDPPNKRAP